MTSIILAAPDLALAAPGGSAPSAGAILQQNTAPQALPSVPGAVIDLPAPKQQASASSLAFKVSHIVISGNTLIATTVLAPLVKGLEGQTAHLSDLQAAGARITALYRARGYPLAYAYLPAQKIKNGVVTIAVDEPHYDRINIQTSANTQGHGRFRAAQAKKTLGLRSGQPIAQATLERGLLLLNQTPGVRVAGTLIPGTKPATSSLDVTVHNTPPVQASAGIDNYGNKATGRIRGLFQASIDDPFGYGGQIAVNGLHTESDLLNSAGINLMSPDIWHGLRMGAYGSHTHYTLGGDFSALEEHGDANQYGVYARMPLILAPGKILNARLDLLRDDFEQSSTVVGLNDQSHINLARLTLAGSRADNFGLGGVTSGGVVVTTGNKHIDTASAQQADALGPNTAGSFWIGQIQLKRLQRLGHGFRLHATVSGQIASRNLDGSQKFYLGGPYGVMSCTVGQAGGDEGMLARLGLFHAIPLPVPGDLTAGALLQGGEVWLNHDRYPGAATDNRLELAAGGVQVAYHWAGHVALTLNYSHRLGHNTVPNDTNHDDELWFSLRIGF